MVLIFLNDGAVVIYVQGRIKEQPKLKEHNVCTVRT